MRFGRLVFVLLSCAFYRRRLQAPAKERVGPSGFDRKSKSCNAGTADEGILYPNSNVILFARGTITRTCRGEGPGHGGEPVGRLYGKWEAVENSSLALVEAANLLTVPGRKCSDGRAVPVANADWPKLVQDFETRGLLDGGPVDFDGRWVGGAGMRNDPPPIQAQMPLLIGSER